MTDIFEEGNDQKPVVDDDTQVIAPSIIDDLVGEGKKFKTVEDLAKGKKEADEFIERLKREQAELRDELQKRLGMEELLNKVKTAQKEPEENHPAFDEAALDALVTEKLSSKEKERQMAANAELANSKMVETYGDVAKAKEVLLSKAADLGMEPVELHAMAQRNPKAFLSLMGVGSKASVTPAKTPSGTTNPTAMSTQHAGADPNTYAYYSAMRRDNPRLYYTAKIQNEMAQKAEEARRSGRDFYKT